MHKTLLEIKVIATQSAAYQFFHKKPLFPTKNKSHIYIMNMQNRSRFNPHKVVFFVKFNCSIIMFKYKLPSPKKPNDKAATIKKTP